MKVALTGYLPQLFESIDKSKKHSALSRCLNAFGNNINARFVCYAQKFLYQVLISQVGCNIFPVTPLLYEPLIDFQFIGAEPLEGFKIGKTCAKIIKRYLYARGSEHHDGSFDLSVNGVSAFEYFNIDATARYAALFQDFKAVGNVIVIFQRRTRGIRPDCDRASLVFPHLVLRADLFEYPQIKRGDRALFFGGGKDVVGGFCFIRGVRTADSQQRFCAYNDPAPINLRLIMDTKLILKV